MIERYCICDRCKGKIKLADRPRVEIFFTDKALDYKFLCKTCTIEFVQWLKTAKKAEIKPDNNYKCLDCGSHIEGLKIGSKCPFCAKIREK